MTGSRLTELDQFKGIAVLAMLFVHPFLYLTNFRGETSHYAWGAFALTIPIAPAFLFALGYAMALKARTFKKIAHRAFVTLLVAACFGFVSYWLAGTFFFSVLFCAVIIVFLAGFIGRVKKPLAWVVSMMALMSVFHGYEIYSGNIWDLPVALHGSLFLSFGIEDKTWAWNTPVFPYLYAGLLGALAARQTCSLLTQGILSAIACASVFVSWLFILQPTASFLLYSGILTVGISLLPFLLGKLEAFSPYKALSWMGKNVLFIYVTHFPVLFVCIWFLYGFFPDPNAMLVLQGAPYRQPQFIEIIFLSMMLLILFTLIAKMRVNIGVPECMKVLSANPFLHYQAYKKRSNKG